MRRDSDIPGRGVFPIWNRWSAIFVSQAPCDWNSARAEKLGAAVNREDYLRIRAELEAETPYEEST